MITCNMREMAENTQINTMLEMNNFNLWLNQISFILFYSLTIQQMKDLVETEEERQIPLEHKRSQTNGICLK